MTLWDRVLDLMLITTLVKGILVNSLDKLTNTAGIKPEKWAEQVKLYDTNRIRNIGEIYDQVQLLGATPYGHAKIQNLTYKIGKARYLAKTVRGNFIPYFNISRGSYSQQPYIIIIGGMLASHWFSVAAAMHIAQNLIVGYNAYHEYISKLSWIIVPVLNPDGYNETLTNHSRRNWVKNMYTSNKTTPECFGVNLAMNFEYQWMQMAYENSSWCHQEYGDKPFSQIESKALRDTIQPILNNIRMFVVLKQGIRAIMYPFRFTHSLPSFWKFYELISKKSALAASRLYGRKFSHGHVLKFEKKGAGEADDWIEAHFGRSLAFTFQIEEWQNNDREFPSGAVKMVNDETFAAVRTFAMIGRNHTGFGYLPSEISAASLFQAKFGLPCFFYLLIWLLKIWVYK